jgi:hypothetical protein
MIHVTLKLDDPYPGRFLAAGLDKLNQKWVKSYPTFTHPGDILVIWTPWKKTIRWAASHRHRRAGGLVLVMENGSIPVIKGERFWQLAWDGHNGSGTHRTGGPERWHDWGLDITPWRTDGDHILICAQRGVRDNDPEITHPSDWPDRVIRKIRGYTNRPILYRPHPGAPRKPCLPRRDWAGLTVCDAREPLKTQLRGCWAAVVYTSSAATECLLSGVPVFYDGPNIAMREAASQDFSQINNPRLPDRQGAFERMAWCQWSSDELSNGKAWRWLVLGSE